MRWSTSFFLSVVAAGFFVVAWLLKFGGEDVAWCLFVLFWIVLAANRGD